MHTFQTFYTNFIYLFFYVNLFHRGLCTRTIFESYIRALAKLADSTLKENCLEILIESLHILSLIKLKMNKTHRILTNVKCNIFDRAGNF